MALQTTANIGWLLGITVTIVGLVISIIKLYQDAKSNISTSAKEAERTKSKIFQAETEINRLKEDMEKVESRLQAENRNLVTMFEKMEEKIEHKLDDLQKTLIDFLKEKSK